MSTAELVRDFVLPQLANEAVPPSQLAPLLVYALRHSIAEAVGQTAADHGIASLVAAISKRGCRFLLSDGRAVRHSPPKQLAAAVVTGLQLCPALWPPRPDGTPRPCFLPPSLPDTLSVLSDAYATEAAKQGLATTVVTAFFSAVGIRWFPPI
eukprot:4989536-Pleurochrysis_carterae.AAC.1